MDASNIRRGWLGAALVFSLLAPGAHAGAVAYDVNLKL
jgi:hypothetical protein